MVTCKLLLAGCATTMATAGRLGDGRVPPSGAQVDYSVFALAWTGHLRPKVYAKPFARMPSDARLMPVDSEAQANARFRELRSQFRAWCAAMAATPVDRALDMQAAGDGFLVCESGGEKLAALRIYLDLEATQQGRRELLIQHWYPDRIGEYLADVGHSSERMAAEDRARRERSDAVFLRERQLSDIETARRAEQRARVATLPSPAACRVFERQSNAMRTRLSAGVELNDARRHLSDLVVAYDECAGLRSSAPSELLELYRFNLQSLQLFVEAWANGLASATLRVEGDRRRLDAMQSKFPLVETSGIDGIHELVAKTIRFDLDR